MFILFYVVPCIVPLIVGVFLMGTEHNTWVRMLALLTLKPVIATPLWLLSLFLFRSFESEPPVSIAILPVLYIPVGLSFETLLPIPIIGCGLTATIIWIYRASLRTMPYSVLALVLVLDTLRWGSTYLTNLVVADSIDMFTWPAVIMPSIFALAAWICCGTYSRANKHMLA